MPVKQSRQTLSRDEIVEIVKTNTDLFKDQPEFASFITDLALYLLENHYEQVIEKRQLAEGAAAGDKGAVAERRKVPRELTDTAVSSFAKRYKILQDLSATGRKVSICANCGARVTGQSLCPGCGSIMA